MCDVESERRSLFAKLLRTTRKSCIEYGLISAGDRILVALSGGKDSYTMLSLLRSIRERAPFDFELVAVHLDQKQPGYDGRSLVAYLEKSGVEFEILAEDTYSVVVEHVEEGGTYCSLCSRLRRGILYSAAERLRCNKIALGHHRDDSLETLLINMFYAGKMQAMPASYTTDDRRFQVIRPMIECAEKDIAAFAALEGYPIIPCNLCGSQPGLVRDQMSALLQQLEANNPNIRQVMLNAIKNVRPTHLLDRDLLAAWTVRPPEVRPDPPPKETIKHAEAAPKISSRLRVLS